MVGFQYIIVLLSELVDVTKMKTNQNTLAIMITGAVTSGKSTFGKNLSKENGLAIINESSVGNYYKILDNINPKKYPKVIYEHCQIHKKYYIVKALYDKSYILFLDVSEEVLLNNYKKRLKISSKGDYSKIDPISQQNKIRNQLEDIKVEYESENHKLISIRINSYSDYKLISPFIE